MIDVTVSDGRIELVNESVPVAGGPFRGAIRATLVIEQAGGWESMPGLRLDSVDRSAVRTAVSAAARHLGEDAAIAVWRAWVLREELVE